MSSVLLQQLTSVFNQAEVGLRKYANYTESQRVLENIFVYVVLRKHFFKIFTRNFEASASKLREKSQRNLMKVIKEI